jgi:hypothetical protein
MICFKAIPAGIWSLQVMISTSNYFKFNVKHEKSAHMPPAGPSTCWTLTVGMAIL